MRKLLKILFGAIFCASGLRAVEIQIHQKPLFTIINPCQIYTLINSVEHHPTKNLFCITCTHASQLVLYKMSRSGRAKIVQRLTNPKAHLSAPQHAIFSPDGKSLIAANWADQTLVIYERKKDGLFSETPTVIIPAPEQLSAHRPHGITISPSGHFLAVAYGVTHDFPRAITIFQLPKKDKKCALLCSISNELPGIPKGITFSPDGTHLLVTFADINCIAIFEFDKEQLVLHPTPRQLIQGKDTEISRPEDIKISPDGTYCVITNSTEHRLTFYHFDKTTNRITQRTPCGRLQNPESNLYFPHGVTFSRDGALLFVTQFGHIQATNDGGIAWDSAVRADEAKVNIYKLRSS